MSIQFGLVAVAFLLSLGFTRRLLDPASRFHVLDHPNERSLHQRPVPRTGGVALLLALGTTMIGAWMLLQQAGVSVWIFAGAALLGIVSYLEDHRGVRRRYRLLVQLLAAFCLVPAGLLPAELSFAGHTLELGDLGGTVLGLIGCIWMINLYNFMDGMDGFAGGMTVFGFGALALAGWTADAALFGLVNMLVVASAAGFLVWNFPPARVFMGDAGSVTLGFLAAAMSLWAQQEGILPLWASGLAFSPFIVDATVTIVRRAARRERIWEPHRSHHYQRLVRLGWGHRKTVLRAYLLMGACAAGALQGARMAPRDQLWLLGFWIAIYGLIALKVRLLEGRSGVVAP